MLVVTLIDALLGLIRIGIDILFDVILDVPWYMAVNVCAFFNELSILIVVMAVLLTIGTFNGLEEPENFLLSFKVMSFILNIT